MLDAAGQEKKSQGAKKDAAGHIFFPTGQGFFRFHEIRFLLVSALSHFGFDVHAASFLEVDKPQPVVLYEVVKGFLTGSTPDVGEMHHIRA